MPKSTEEIYQELLAKGNEAQQQANNILTAYDNRGQFQYDALKDPMYLAAKDQYTRLGQKAMKDTMGQAAGLTGGYGNTYGQAVGNQAYNDYMTQLSGLGAEYASQARAAWDAEGDRMLQRYNLAQDAANLYYNQGRDALNDIRYDKEFEYNTSRDAESDRRWNLQWEYQMQRDARNDALDRWQQLGYADSSVAAALGIEVGTPTSDQRYQDLQNQRYEEELAYDRDWQQRQWDYNRERDALSDQRYQDELAYNREQDARDSARSNVMLMIQMGRVPSDEQLAQAGLSREDANYMANYYRSQMYATGGSSGGGSSGGSSGRSSGGGGGGYSAGSGTGETTNATEGTPDAYTGAGGQSVPDNKLRDYALRLAATGGSSAGMDQIYSLLLSEFPADSYDVGAAFRWILAHWKDYRSSANVGGSTKPKASREAATF